MEAAISLSSDVGVKSACESLGISRAGFYRERAKRHLKLVKPKVLQTPPRALSKDERQKVLDILHSERFVDKAPSAVYATLLDEGEYHCSIRTMYRILEENQEVRERRDLLRHPN